MGFDSKQHEGHGGQAPARETGGVAPGKRTLTDRIAADERRVITGVPYADYGAKCEHPGQQDNPDCVLDKDHRDRIIGLRQGYILTASANYHAAVGNTLLRLLTEQQGGWGGGEEALFWLVAGPVSARLIAGLKAARTAAADSVSPAYRAALLKVNDDLIKETVVLGSKSARADFKEGAHGMKEGNAEKAQFVVDVVQESIKPMTDYQIEAAYGMDDHLLIASMLAYRDRTVHSVANYSSDLVDMLASYDRNRITDIGTERLSYRAGELKMLYYRTEDGKTHRRLAMFRDRGLREVTYSANGSGYGAHDLQFEQWIDDSMIHVAWERYKAAGKRIEKVSHYAVKRLAATDDRLRDALQRLEGNAFLDNFFGAANYNQGMEER
jgi:hypothetical protein